MPPVNVDSIISLGQNVAFLLCLPLLYHFVCRLLKKAPALTLNLVTGVVFALIAIIGMLSPLRVSDGIIVDGRVAIIALAAVYSTPSGIIAAALIAIFRVLLGGVGTDSAILIIITSLLIGVLARKYFSVRLNQYQPGKLLIVGVSLVAVTAFWAFMSPFPQTWASFQATALTVSIWYPACTVLLGNLLAQEFIREDMEDELRASRARYLSIVNEQLDLVARWQPDGTLTFVNDAFCKFFGKSAADLIGSNGLSLVNPNIQQGSRQMLAGFTPQQPFYMSTMQLASASGEIHWQEWSNHAFFDARGHLTEIQSIAHDTTERKQTENRLRYQANFQHLLISLATRFINFPVDEWDNAITNALKELGQFLNAQRCVINLLDDSQTFFTRAYEWHSSEVQPFLHITEPVPDPSVLLPKFWNGEDIIIANVELADQFPDLQRLGARINVKGVALIPILHSGQLVGSVTVSWTQSTDMAQESLSVMHVVGEIYLNAIDRKRTEQEIRQLNADLECRVVERTTQLVKANQQLEQEIVERTEAENALRASESQLRVLLETSPMATFVITEQKDILYINPIAATLLGIDREQSSQHKVDDFAFFKHERDALWEKYHEQGWVHDLEIQYRVSPTDWHWGLFTARPVQFAGQPAILLSMIDVTELKLIQKAEREQRALADALLDSAITITGTLEMDKVIHSILSNLERVVAHDLSNIIVLEDDQFVLSGQQTFADGFAHFEALSTVVDPAKAEDIRDMQRTRQPLILSDIQDMTRLAWLGSVGPMRSYLGLPIVAGQEVIGIISLSSRAANAFMPFHSNYLQIFALQAGVAIQNARLYRQAHALATLEERQRLARELHDSVSQTLFSASAIAESLPRILERHPQKVVAYLQNLQQFTRGAMAEMRSLLIELRPEALTKTELGTLLKQLCDAFTGKTQIEVEKQIAHGIFLPDAIQLAYYRIAQETLNNIAKHAQATQVVVVLEKLSNDKIEMRIKDNGTGFDLHGISADHFGLQIIQERAAEVDAECIIRSQPGQGSEVILRRSVQWETVSA